MSKNAPGLIFFTPEQLREHDLDVAEDVQDIVVARLVDEFVHMTPGQTLRAARGNGEHKRLSREALGAALDAARAVCKAEARDEDDH
jgi:hypothetical protein